MVHQWLQVELQRSLVIRPEVGHQLWGYLHQSGVLMAR